MRPRLMVMLLAVACLVGSRIGGSPANAAGPQTGTSTPSTSTPAPVPTLPPRTCKGCGSPVVHAYPGLYHRVLGRWVATRMLHHGDIGLFTLNVRIDNPPGYTPRAHLRLRRTIWKAHQAQYDGTIYRVGMNHTALPNGYTRFWITMPFQATHMHGFFAAEFEVTNGHILVVADLRFSVRPVSPRPLTVRQAIQRCAMHPGIADNVVRVQGSFVEDMPPSSGGQDGAMYGSRSVASTTHSGGLRVVVSVLVKEKIGSIRNHSRVRVTGTIHCDQSPSWVAVHAFRPIVM